MRKAGSRQELFVSTSGIYEFFRHARHLQRIDMRNNGID